jgi:hypothetical protein
VYKNDLKQYINNVKDDHYLYGGDALPPSNKEDMKKQIQNNRYGAISNKYTQQLNKILLILVELMYDPTTGLLLPSADVTNKVKTLLLDLLDSLCDIY